mgnify:CR=1 FL=1
MADHPPRRMVPFSAEMSEALELLKVTYPQITHTQLSSEALRRGLLGMLACVASVPTGIPQNLVELRRVG